ncbi:MAG: hypothetical protein DYH13_02515 [Alphaproteobacteria bacterium PRO2]|nr:hypothetical protein [Alphaproteobacteria bacterium PRO2]
MYKALRKDESEIAPRRIRIGGIEMRIMEELEPYEAKGRTYVLAHILEPVSLQDGVDAETGIEVMTSENGLRYAMVPFEMLKQAVHAGERSRKEKGNLYVVKKASEPNPPEP